MFHSAVIEHTNRVIYLEDDDVAAITNGSKSGDLLGLEQVGIRGLHLGKALVRPYPTPSLLLI